MSLSAYELERLDNIRRNEEQLEQLGLGGGGVPPKAKRQKRAAPPPAKPSRQSSRLLHEAADVAGGNVAAAKNITGKDEDDVVIVEAEMIDSGDDEAGPSEMVLSSVVVEAEGYKLFLSTKSATGYVGVREQHGLSLIHI